MIAPRRPTIPDPNQYPPEASMGFVLPAKAVTTLPGGKALIKIPLIAAPAFVRSLMGKLQGMGMWDAQAPSAHADAPLLTSEEIAKAFGTPSEDHNHD